MLSIQKTTGSAQKSRFCKYDEGLSRRHIFGSDDEILRHAYMTSDIRQRQGLDDAQHAGFVHRYCTNSR